MTSYSSFLTDVLFSSICSSSLAVSVFKQAGRVRRELADWASVILRWYTILMNGLRRK
jgi:hypothetical protein